MRLARTGRDGSGMSCSYVNIRLYFEADHYAPFAKRVSPVGCKGPKMIFLICKCQQGRYVEVYLLDGQVCALDAVHRQRKWQHFAEKGFGRDPELEGYR